jgi:hypothetical protein
MLRRVLEIIGLVPVLCGREDLEIVRDVKSTHAVGSKRNDVVYLMAYARLSVDPGAFIVNRRYGLWVAPCGRGFQAGGVTPHGSCGHLAWVGLLISPVLLAQLVALLRSVSCLALFDAVPVGRSPFAVLACDLRRVRGAVIPFLSQVVVLLREACGFSQFTLARQVSLAVFAHVGALFLAFFERRQRLNYTAGGAA